MNMLKSRHFSAGVSHDTICSFSDCSKNNLKNDEVKPYLKIIQDRNILAHNPEKSSSSVLMKIKKKNGDIEEYNEQKFINIRKDIQEFKKLFQEIINDLNN